MASLIQYCESGNQHDDNALQFELPYLGIKVDTGFYSRKREINSESSFSVVG
jgi:sarcosine oxidase subunit beta